MTTGKQTRGQAPAAAASEARRGGACGSVPPLSNTGINKRLGAGEFCVRDRYPNGLKPVGVQLRSNRARPVGNAQAALMQLGMTQHPDLIWRF